MAAVQEGIRPVLDSSRKSRGRVCSQDGDFPESCGSASERYVRDNDVHRDEDKNDFKTVVAKLDELCVRRTSRHVIRDKFFQLKQEGRAIDLFMTEVRKQAKDCAFGELKDDLMLHVLIRGLDGERMRRRLFETDKLTLEKAIQMCRTMEATSADLQLWSGTKEEEVAAITQGAKGKKKQEYKQPPQKQQSQRRTCGKCGQQHERAKCPAYGKTCFRCQKLNHNAKFCKSREEAQMVDADSDQDSVLHIGRKEAASKGQGEDQQASPGVDMPARYSCIL